MVCDAVALIKQTHVHIILYQEKYNYSAGFYYISTHVLCVLYLKGIV